jgi:hypothetical protein
VGIIIPGGGSFVPTEVQERLAQIDPRLAVVPKQRSVYDKGAEDDRQQLQWIWYVVLKWPEGDPRWRMVQYGQQSPENAFDILGQLPADCPLEQIPGYLANQISRRNGHPAKLAEQVATWNRDQTLRNGAPLSEFAEELFEANKDTLLAADGVKAVKPVAQYNPAQTGKKNRPREA